MVRSVSCKKRLKCVQSVCVCVDDISEVIFGEKK